MRGKWGVISSVSENEEMLPDKLRANYHEKGVKVELYCPTLIEAAAVKHTRKKARGSYTL